MIWTDTPCRTTCWNDGNEVPEAYGSAPSGMHCDRSTPGWKTNARFPTSSCRPTPTWKWTTSLTNIRQGGMFADVMLCEKAVEPVGESKSDFEIVLEVAKKLATALKKRSPEVSRPNPYGRRSLTAWVRRAYFLGRVQGKELLSLQRGRGLGIRPARLQEVLRRS